MNKDSILNINISDNHQVRINNNIIIITFSIVVWFFFPIISILFFLFLLGNEKIILWKQVEIFLIVLISCSFGLISYVTGSGGAIDTDMVRYRQMFDIMSNQGLGYFSNENFLFLIINWFIANYISPDGQVMSFVFTSLSYFFILLSIRNLNKYYVDQRYHFIVLLSVIFIISIITTTEFLKQVLASSLFLYGLTCKLMHRKHAYLWLIPSMLVHVSSTILLLPIFFYNLKIIRKFIFPILFICLIFSQIDIISVLFKFANLPILESLGLSAKLESYSEFNDWGGSKRYYLIFLFYLIQIFPLLHFYWKNNDFKNPICILVILTICILLFSMSNNHNFARLTRNLYPIQILALSLSIAYIKFSYRKVWIYFIYICLFSSNVIEFIRTMTNSDYHATFMGNDWINLFVGNVLAFIHYSV